MKKLKHLIAGVFMGIMLVSTPNYAAESQPSLQTMLNIKDVKKIEIKGKQTVKENKKITLKVKYSPKNATIKNVTWTSSKPKVATVNKKGVVTGKSKGTCYIKAVSTQNEKVAAKIKVTVKKEKTYSNSDLRLLAAVVFCEAGNQSYAGKKAVAIVVMNRVASSKFPNDVSSVIYQRGQFTCTGSFLNGSLSKYDNGKLDKDCIKATKEVLEGSRKVSIGGKDILMNDYLFFSRYVRGSRMQIDDHQFK